jgi:hypothetical protein
VLTEKSFRAKIKALKVNLRILFLKIIVKTSSAGGKSIKKQNKRKRKALPKA